MLVDYKPIVSYKDYVKGRNKYPAMVSDIMLLLKTHLTTQDNYAYNWDNKTRQLFSKFFHRSLVIDLVVCQQYHGLQPVRITLYVNWHIVKNVTKYGDYDIEFKFNYSVVLSDNSLQTFDYRALRSEILDIIDQNKADKLRLKSMKIGKFKIGEFDIEIDDVVTLPVGRYDIELNEE